MAVHAPNATRRYWLDYTVHGRQHSTMFRTSEIFSPANFGSTMNSILNMLDALLYPITVVQCRTSALGSDFSTPVTTGIEGNVYGTGTPVSEMDDPQFLSFVGRSTGGTRVRATFFGLVALDNNFRLSPAEASAVGDVADALNLADGFGYAADNLSATWQRYANVGSNAYWQRKIRRSG